MRTAITLLVLYCLIGCMNRPTTEEVPFTPPWLVVSDGVRTLVDDQAELSAFERYRESSVEPRQLHNFASTEDVTAHAKYSPSERKQQRDWFESSTAVWHYTFESQFSGILFVDAAGRVRNAILLGY